MGLLQADLRVLANLPSTPAGRRIAISTATGLALLGLMSWWGCREMLSRPDLLQLIQSGSSGDSQHGMFGFALMPCSVAATWLGLAIAQRQLFESPELALWQTAPMARWRPAAQVLLRACFLAMMWGTALAGPMLAVVLNNSNAPTTAYLLVPVAMLACAVPLIASLLSVQILLVRFLAGRWLRMFFALLGALASVAFSTWLLLGLFTPGGERAANLAASVSGPGKLPWMIDTAASLLTSAAHNVFDGTSFAIILAWLLAALLTFWATALLHPRAVEKHQLSEGPLFGRRRTTWPIAVASAIRRKEFAQVLQQPAALMSFLGFAVLVVTLVSKQVLVSGILGSWQLPRELAHLGAMLVHWWIAVLLVLYAHMGRIAMWDGAQWSLYMSAPARPAAILWGKLQAIALFLMWPLLLVGAAGSQLLGASPLTLLLFTGIALAGTASALGVLSIIGTSPRLMRPDDGGQIVQGGRSFLAAMLLVILFELASAPAVQGWWWLTERLRRQPMRSDELLPYAPWVVGLAWLLGLTVAGIGIGIGARNYARLSRAR
jgi:hypothetical protein